MRMRTLMLVLLLVRRARARLRVELLAVLELQGILPKQDTVDVLEW